MAEHDDLSGALRKARLAEAAHFEAVLGIKDSKSLRLQVLKDELIPVIAATPEAAHVFDLALVPGEPPRLWIDLISFVEMEPDYRTTACSRTTKEAARRYLKPPTGRK